MLTINNCNSQRALRRQDIYSPKWLMLRVLVYVMHIIALAAADVVSESLTFLEANYLK